MIGTNRLLVCMNASRYGGDRKSCMWGGHYGQVMSKCPLSLHYQTPEQMLSKQEDNDDPWTAEVCVPGTPLAWKPRTDKCDCHSSLDARNMATEKKAVDPERVTKGPGWRKLATTAAPTLDEVKAAAKRIRAAWKGTGEMSGKELREALESMYQQQFPVGRKWQFKNWGLEGVGSA
jgi:hypothetical protein